MNPINLSVYLVTDPVLMAPGLDVCEIVDRACAAGVFAVQYRDKECSFEQYVQTARKLKSITSVHGVPLILNDYVMAVALVGAEGVHVGQDDTPVSVVRQLVGASAIVGVSVFNRQQAESAARDGASYVAVNGVFPTGTKHFDDSSGLGLAAVTEISRAVDIPVVGIGGINVFNAASVIRAGASGVAVVTAITMRPDIEEAVRELLIQATSLDSKLPEK